MYEDIIAVIDTFDKIFKVSTLLCDKLIIDEKIRFNNYITYYPDANYFRYIEYEDDVEEYFSLRFGNFNFSTSIWPPATPKHMAMSTGNTDTFDIKNLSTEEIFQSTLLKDELNFIFDYISNYNEKYNFIIHSTVLNLSLDMLLDKTSLILYTLEKELECTVR